MRLLILINEERLTDDRAYLLGALVGRFSEIETVKIDRRSDVEPGISGKTADLILNLAASKRRAIQSSIERQATEMGIPISPPAGASWGSIDKRSYVETYADLSPPTTIARSVDDVLGALDLFGGDIVIKDPLGGRGANVERIRNRAEIGIAEDLMASSIDGSGELVVQPFMSGFVDGDRRMIMQRVEGGAYEIVAHIQRKPRPGEWKSNINNGGKANSVVPLPEEIAFAQEIARRSNLDNVAIDVSRHEGRLYFIEHNQGYGGLIDFDLDCGTRNVETCVRFLLALAEKGEQVRGSTFRS